MQKSKYLIHVDGIRCASCVQKLESLPQIIPGIHESRVYFGESLLQVTLQGHTPIDTILSEIKKLGFNAQFLENKNEIFELNKISNRKFLAQIGVAGFCTGNIMLFSIAIYAGASGIYKTAFAYSSFLVFLPLIFYSGTAFYKSAWSSLKIKSLSIDFPISVALILGFLLSTYNLIFKHYDFLYYDSTASFIFLILSARYILRRLQQSFVSTYSQLNIANNKSIKIYNSITFKSKEQLQPNDIIELQHHDILPAEATLLSDSSEWNMAFITGENLPQFFHKNCKITSGAVLQSERAVLRVDATYSESYMSQIVSKLEEVNYEKTSHINLADRFSHFFIASVFTISLLFFIVYSQTNIFEAFQRALSLLIVACPCALALGTPLAYLMGVYKAKQSGILVLKKDVFDRVLKVKSLIFDKTGTLTEGILSLQKIEPENLDLINIILNLEKTSSHPIATSFRKKYSKYFQELHFLPQEIAGLGVQGYYNSDLYEFIKGPQANLITAVLKKNGETILTSEFSDHIHSQTPEFIQKLSQRVQNIFLLTGDNSYSAEKIGKILGIKSVLANQTPSMKLDIIQKNAPCMMIGDGLNDSLALKSAEVGVAVQGAVQLAADSSDVYLLKKGISQIYKLFEISDNVRRTLISNLILSLIYNLTAGTLALLGYINPLCAAILMPLSSLAILFNTWRSSR